MIEKILFLVYAIVWLIMTILAYLGTVGCKRVDGAEVPPLKQALTFLGWPIFLCIGLILILSGTIKVTKRKVD